MRVQAAERERVPFLVTRDAADDQRIFPLDPARAHLTIGRDEENAIVIDWDPTVSRTHVELERVGAVWVAADDGLSRNGTLVNGTRLHGRARLADGDVLHAGATDLLFRDPSRDAADTTWLGDEPPAVDVTPAQRRVLVALARPCVRATGLAIPATNEQIAVELVVSVDAVKKHLQGLFGRFGLADLPQNRKRVELVDRALAAGVIGPGDFAG
jgi:hypothetical protein